MILGVDPGSKRVGLALADTETRFAYPLTTIERERAIEEIHDVIEDRGVRTVVVGRPISLSGDEGPAADEAHAFADELRASVDPTLTVIEFDERLTSVLAEKQMRSSGVSSKKARGRVDEVAAQIMLQNFLDSRSELP